MRALALLKAFSDTRPDLSLGELARATQLKKTTAFRLLAALENEGMVTRNPDSDTYRLGPEIVVLGGRALRSNDLRSASHPELERLARETGETVTLEILVGGEVLILDEVLGRHLVGSIPSLGTRWPAQFTSTGKILLAYLSNEERRVVIREAGPSHSQKAETQADLLEAEIEQIRRQGYATAVEELEAGFVAVGAPVRNFSGKVVAAISAGGPSTRLNPQRVQEIIPLIQEAATCISNRLGFQPTAN